MTPTQSTAHAALSETGNMTAESVDEIEMVWNRVGQHYKQ